MKGSAEQALSVALKNLTGRKALRLNVLNLTGRSPMTDYFVICHGESERQVRSLAESVVEDVREQTGRKPSIEGINSSRWVLLDYGDFVIHIFLEDVRELYRLEELWFDAPAIDPTALAG